MTFVRRAARDDVNAIVDMADEFEAYLKKLSPEVMEAVIPKEKMREVLMLGFMDEKHRIYVAEDEGKLVGFADFWTYPELLHGGWSGYLNNIFIREGHRGKGVGSMLMARLLEDARKADVVAMHIPVLAENVEAMKFYRKKGISEQLFMMETRMDNPELMKN